MLINITTAEVVNQKKKKTLGCCSCHTKTGRGGSWSRWTNSDRQIVTVACCGLLDNLNNTFYIFSSSVSLFRAYSLVKDSVYSHCTDIAQLLTSAADR